MYLRGFNADNGNDSNNETIHSSTRPTVEVDAEGCEVFENKWPHLLLISSESPLALNWFDRRTGWSEPSNSSTTQLPSLHIPDYIADRAGRNKGFEAVTALSSLRLPSSLSPLPETGGGESSSAFWGESFILTTTEAHLEEDPPGFHRLLFWNTDEGGQPLLEMGHWASRWKEIKDDPHEFLSITDMTYWPEQELVIVLERGYDGATNMIHLSAVELIFPMSRVSQSLMNWTQATMDLAPEESVQLQVDNYESICLLPQGATQDDPNQRLALLVNDENHNPKQIGTQFVLLRIEVVRNERAAQACQWRSSDAIWLLLAGAIILVAGVSTCLVRSQTSGYQPTADASGTMVDDGDEDNEDRQDRLA